MWHPSFWTTQHWTGVHWTPGTGDVPPPSAPAGAGGKTRYPRRIYINGKIYWVNSPEEERRLLRQWLDSLEMKAQAETEPVAVQRARRLVVRTQRRLAKVDARELEWDRILREEDEELILLM